VVYYWIFFTFSNDPSGPNNSFCLNAVILGVLKYYAELIRETEDGFADPRSCRFLDPSKNPAPNLELLSITALLTYYDPFRREGKVYGTV